MHILVSFALQVENDEHLTWKWNKCTGEAACFVLSRLVLWLTAVRRLMWACLLYCRIHKFLFELVSQLLDCRCFGLMKQNAKPGLKQPALMVTSVDTEAVMDIRIRSRNWTLMCVTTTHLMTLCELVCVLVKINVTWGVLAKTPDVSQHRCGVHNMIWHTDDLFWHKCTV